MQIKKLLENYKKEALEGDEPQTYIDELNRQCRLLIVPATLLAMLSWLPYVDVDRNLHPHFSMFPFLRLLLSLVTVTALGVHFFSTFKLKSYRLLFLVICYVQLSAAVILGLVAADPVYMGGYCILIMLLPMLPFLQKDLYLLLGLSVTIFAGLGFWAGMSFTSWEQKYGIYNWAAAIAISATGIYVLDSIRKKRYDKRCLLQIANQKLEKTTGELEQANEELQKANEVKSELLGLAAHDLKNPLQIIIGYTGLLQQKMKEDPYAYERLNIINRSSDKMLNLINALLAADSIDSGRIKMNITEVDVTQLAESVIESLHPLSSKKSQEITLKGETECIIQADHVLLQEVMDNLLSNAIKFSPLGKPITIVVECIKEKKKVIFKVKDEGPGLTREDKGQLFEKFSRLSAKPTGGESSTGLGLAIIRNLVEMHEGNISVESEPGKGSTFIVVLPTTLSQHSPQQTKTGDLKN